MIRIYSTVFSKLRPGRAPSGKNFTLNISMSFLSLSGSPDIFQRFYRDFGGYQSTFGVKYSRMYQVKFFEGCLLQISLGPFLNTLSHLTHVSGVGQYVKKSSQIWKEWDIFTLILVQRLGTLVLTKSPRDVDAV